MQAQVLHQPAPVAEEPLRLTTVETPTPGPDEILVRIRVCGVCHTDLHVVEGELPNIPTPIIPGHEIVGVVEAVGSEVTRFTAGDRVGGYWLHEADLTCQYCQRDQQNLCPNATWTGYTAQGGYAEYITIRQDFAVPIPERFSDLEAAPLLCAGVVGYRSLRLAELSPGERFGIYGFGASGHLCIQVARHWDCEVYVFTRSAAHKEHARALGAVWVGEAQDDPPQPLDCAVIFAPAGWIVPHALRHLRKAGTLCINAIHMSDIPALPYRLLWEERTLRTTANVTPRDAGEFLPLAAEIPIEVTVQGFPLAEANRVLAMVKNSEINGAAVLQMD